MKTDCIFLITKQDRINYIKITRNGVAIDAHRYFYEQKFGKIPKGKVLDHLCRIRSCINVEHLEMVTSAENTRRGRAAKLTREDVNKIKKLYKEKKFIQVELATIYRVGQDQISRIINERRWKI